MSTEGLEYELVHHVGVKRAMEIIAQEEKERAKDKSLFELYRETKELLKEKAVF